jgi:fructose-1,6-bisphosphatase I
MPAATLDAFLNSYLGPGDELRSAVVATVRQLTQAAVKVRHVINQGVLGNAFAGARGANADGDVQKDLDVYADDIFLDAMRHAPVALYASEELEQPVLLDRLAPLAIAIDPLDGSSNIDANVSIGTIFSLLPATGAPDANPAAAFLQAGTAQLGAGFFIYGPQLALVLSLGSGTHVFVLSRRTGSSSSSDA